MCIAYHLASHVYAWLLEPCAYKLSILDTDFSTWPFSATYYHIRLLYMYMFLVIDVGQRLDVTAQLVEYEISIKSKDYGFNSLLWVLVDIGHLSTQQTNGRVWQVQCPLSMTTKLC